METFQSQAKDPFANTSGRGVPKWKAWTGPVVAGARAGEMDPKLNEFEQVLSDGHPLWTDKTDNHENITFLHYVVGVNNITVFPP